MPSRRGQSEESSEEDEVDEQMQDPEARSDLPPASQYERLRDADFKHLDHAEEDDQRATQRLKNRPELIGENHAALNAVIQRIEVFNFMCHRRLRVDLGPLLNFIVGENGSGKSAILTAITLCLGGKASSTNRGGSLRSFIKEGEDHASLVVWIKNQGPDAYKPDVFGDSIIVERHFNKTGSSGFKLKGTSSNRIISTKKADVDDVVEYYCLQVDNPLNVLSQDNARQFLNAASPATKYKYFLQGTQLEQLDNDLAIISEYIDNLESSMQGYDETVAYLKERKIKAQKLKETLEKNGELRAKTRLYAKQLAWAQVAEQETILQEKENNIIAAEQEIIRVQQIVGEKSAALQKQDEIIRSAEAAADNLQEEEPDMERKQEEAQETFDNARATVQKLHLQEREVREQLRIANEHAKDREEKVIAEEQRLEERNGGAVAEKQEILDAARRAAELAREKRAEHLTSRAELTEKFAESETQYQEAVKLVDDKRTEINGVETRIRTLSSRQTDPLAAYDQKMPQLLKLIEEDREFRQKPIGPLGLHVQLTKPEWSSILERTLGNTLNSFIVSCREDQARLSRYLERLKIRECHVSITRPNLSLHNLKEPEEQFETVLRVLKFKDERVRNHLIISNSIEQLLLVTTRKEAESIMLDGLPPQNVVACITHHTAKRGHGLSLTNKRGNLETSFINPYPGRPRMKSDSDVEVNLQKETLRQLQSELKELDSSTRILQQTVQKCSTAVTQHKSRERSLDTAVRNAEAAVNAAEAELDTFDGVDMRLQGLQEELRTAREQENHYGEQFGTLSLEKSEANQAATVAKTALAKAKADSAEINARIAKARDKVKRYRTIRQNILAETNAAHENLEISKEMKKQAERSRDSQVRTVEEYVQGASELVPERVHIPEGESYQSIERKYETLKEQLKKFEKRVGRTEKEIHDEAANAAEQYDQAERNRENTQRLVSLAKQTLNMRLDKWRMFQRMISASARTNFQYLLSERGFRGSLKLDHKGKRLGIEVEPDETRQNVSGRNTKTLSGGEKSFSSICLLLAIWDAMGSPLRCLDEFDVFMDVVNRGISTNMLVQAARRSVGKQFILITPNAIEGKVKYDKDVHIIR
ncbi:P-loop containing nucleoside triphosphate hydrolase protein [Xylariales sp. PMI_506]|nr:P-loop containing nucleoside triphosphate hydrolase protein [Xylariales sp. PMI_506]